MLLEFTVLVHIELEELKDLAPLCHGLPVKLENGSGGSAQKVMIEIYVESEYLQDFQDELAEVLGGDPLSFIIPTL